MEAAKSQLLKEVFLLHGDVLIEWLDIAENKQREEFLGIDVNRETLKSDLQRIQTGVELLADLKKVITDVKEKYNEENGT